MEKIKIFAFAGSISSDSINKKYLAYAKSVLPEEAEMEIFDLGRLPMFTRDLENNLPEAVAEFKNKIRAADAIFIATPEYNYSVPGVLKNAIDWGSRPHGDNSFGKKSGAIMGASNGRFGTARAQHDLRKILMCVDIKTLNYPEVMIPEGDKKFDADGNITDEFTKTKIAELIQALIAWTKLLLKK